MGIPNTVYLVRHGENKANLTKEFSSRLVDYPLTPKGRLQAEQTANFFMSKPVDAVYSSPLKRAIETAQIIARPRQLEVIIMENFRELDVGDLEKTSPTPETWAIHNSVILDWLNGNKSKRFPGGEDFYTAYERMRSGIEKIIEQDCGKHLIVVAHGGILFTGIGGLCQNVNILELLPKENHNCSITEIEIGMQSGQMNGRLVRWANHDHLTGEAADLVSGFPD